MSLFKTTRWKWWQISLLKIASGSVGIAIGCYWPEVFRPYIPCLLILTAILGIYLSVLYFRD